MLRWFCKPWYLETIEGDLFELYERDHSHDPSRARRLFTWHVIRFFRWRYIKDLEDFQPQTSFGMFKTYLKVSFRSLKKYKSQSLLNVFGLAVGIAGCLLILMHVTDQLKYDKHLADLDRIYRVVLNEKGRYTPARLVSQMSQDYPEIEAGTRVNGLFDIVAQHEKGFITLEGGIIADSTFFEVFPTRFVHGQAETALTDPNTVVLTESMASRLYKDANPLGQVIRSDGTDYTVTAVVADQPRTATIPYQFVGSMPRAFWATSGWWTGNNFFSYLKLREHVKPESLESKFPDFVMRYIGPEILQYRTQYETFEDFIADGNSHSFQLVPMKDIHLHYPNLTLNRPGSYQNLIVFSMIAAFILIIACINYINMSTARSSLRAKEIGMRKVMGSVRGMIAWQFIVESFLISLFAVLTGILLAVAILPFFNRISDSQYAISDLVNLQNMGWFLLILAFTGFLSGSYPALYLSSFKPIAALRGEAVTGSNRRLRSALVVLQFTLSIFLLAATFIVFKQVSLMSNRELGVAADQTFIIKNAGNVADRYEAFRQEAMSKNQVANVGMANSYPSSFMADWNYQTRDEDQVTISPYNLFVNHEILDIWGLQLTSGRFFDRNMATDTATVVVNERLVEELGWEEPLGKVLTRGIGQDFRIIGVVKDFVTGDAKKAGYPLVFRYAEGAGVANASGASCLMVKVTGDYRQTIEHLENAWKKFVPDYPFEGLFMDDSFERLYEGERRFGLLFTGFSLLAVVIACIGLFALVSFTLERKRKEIALRKVLGADITHVMMMVFRGFVRLILMSAIIALPLVFYFGNNWLENYVYRISIGMFQLLAPVVLVLIIAFLTVSHQAYRSAVSNPVQALKEE